ncbi:MAG: hypothetical protein KatS3mg015_2487 [Fimbriimonadales bacterium]|nr:MAG: hypothetical protein KatS3mg015_2487 [Fimbriimonadales bacterium]
MTNNAGVKLLALAALVAIIGGFFVLAIARAYDYEQRDKTMRVTGGKHG